MLEKTEAGCRELLSIKTKCPKYYTKKNTIRPGVLYAFMTCLLFYHIIHR